MTQERKKGYSDGYINTCTWTLVIFFFSCETYYDDSITSDKAGKRLFI